MHLRRACGVQARTAEENRCCQTKDAPKDGDSAGVAGVWGNDKRVVVVMAGGWVNGRGVLHPVVQEDLGEARFDGDELGADHEAELLGDRLPGDHARLIDPVPLLMKNALNATVDQHGQKAIPNPQIQEVAEQGNTPRTMTRGA